MRILHIAESTLGGVGTYLEEVGSFQTVEFGAENVHFVVPDETGSPFARLTHSNQVTGFPRERRSLRSLATLAMTSLRALRDFRPSIVHIHSSFAGAVVRPLIRRVKDCPKTVYCPHGWSFGMTASRSRLAAFALVERRLCARTDLVILNSASELRLAQQFGVRAPSMMIIPNGVALKADALPDASASTRTGSLRLGFIGRFDKQKGLDLLLKAFAQVDRSDLELHIVGAQVVGDSLQAAGLQQNNVINHGWLQRDQVYALLPSFDAVVMPSRWEAMPLVALEAMQCGVPVIGSSRGGIPEVVRHDIDGLIFSLDDPDALVQILSSITREQLLPMGLSSRSRFLDRYTIDRMNLDILAAYQCLVEKSSAPLAYQQSMERE